MKIPSLSGSTLAGEDVDVMRVISGRVSLVILSFRAMGMVSHTSDLLTADLSQLAACHALPSGWLTCTATHL